MQNVHRSEKGDLFIKNLTETHNLIVQTYSSLETGALSFFSLKGPYHFSALFYRMCCEDEAASFHLEH